ncbi:hypothetical protein PQX77_001444 [Marasmius sp. AFHP31]|nr:hypothetical protein PQX77_001444 [Marasmius sp. AFHP31]
MTLRLLVVSAVAAFNLCHALGAQTPFSTFAGNVEELWDLDAQPTVNGTEQLIFESVSSLLQQWPNTRYRNGHNLVPGHIPAGTLLYHGRRDPILPTTPEWTATDPEHSLLFCRSIEGTGCWHLTLVTTRPLKVLYFDGSSAAKMASGSMDSQDIVAWGKVSPERFFDEFNRIYDLCNWAKKVGYDGLVRMEMDFEVMLCDFTAGVKVESFLNLESGADDGPPRPPRHHNEDNWRVYPPSPPPPRRGGHHPPPAPGFGHEHRGLPERHSLRGPSRRARADFEVILAGARHNRFPGESRIKLDLSRLVSFYDTNLVPSLVEARFNATTNRMKHRLQHRLEGISRSDLASVMQRLETPLQPHDTHAEGSGVDWFTLFRVIKDRFADRLEVIRDILNATQTDLDEPAYTVHTQLSAATHPYILYTLNTTSRFTGFANSSVEWAAPAYEACAVTHTRHISSMSALTESEELLLRAAQQTTKEICRTVTRMWAKGVSVGLYTDSEDGDIDREELEIVVTEWKAEIERLMDWLDWNVWLKCRPACGFGEMCYLPTWPLFGRFGEGAGRQMDAGPGPGRPPKGPRFPAPPEPAEARDPQPSCRRILY